MHCNDLPQLKLKVKYSYGLHCTYQVAIRSTEYPCFKSSYSYFWQWNTNFFFNLIASLFFFLYCDIQTNDRHWGIMSKTDQYNNLFQRIWVLIYYYCSSLVSRCVYNTYENRNIPTFVDWPFQIRPYIPLVRVQVSAKEIKIVKFYFTNLSRLL